MDTVQRPLVCLLRACDVPDPYVSALEEAGFEAICEPVLAFDFIHQDALVEALGAAGDYAGLILTSPRAVEALARASAQVEGFPGAWAGNPTFVVGPRTATAVRRLGLVPVGEEAGTGAALADHVARHRADAPWLFLCGNRRNDDLPDALTAATMAIHELCVYRTRLRTDIDLPSALDWLVFFSPSGVEAVQAAAGEEAETIPKAAIGPTTAAALDAVGWPVAAVAVAPTPEAVVAALAGVARP